MSIEIDRILTRVNDIYQAAIIVNKKLNNVSCEDLCDERNLELQAVIAWKLTIIGEASSVLLKKHPEFGKNFPEIDLLSCKRVRNLLVHEYGSVNWTMVFDTCKIIIPSIIESLNVVLKMPQDEVCSRMHNKHIPVEQEKRGYWRQTPYGLEWEDEE